MALNWAEFKFLPLEGILMIKKISLLFCALFISSSSALALDQAEFSKMMTKYLEDEKNLETVSGALQKHFQNQRVKQQQKAQQDQAKAMESQFDNPVSIPVDGSPFKGPEDAKVTVVEFSDFECPYCSRGKAVMEQVLKAYPKDVKVVFKHLPLDFHKNAKPAARATMAAHEQGKFWEMHDKLFENQRNLTEPFFMKTAKDLGLDIEKFKTDFKSGKYDKQIDSDVAIANKNGIRGTPGFFVNGVAVKGARPFEHFKMIIDRWLEKKKG